MKKTAKSFMAAIVAIPLCFASCASTSSAENSSSSNKGKNPRVQVSQHLEIPDTASSVCTEVQDFDGTLSSIELTQDMGNGINLGNTLEAYRSGGSSATTKEPTYYEQLWGQPVTTKKIIEGYKAAGFDTIRIPVAWTNMMDYDHGNYIIGTGYLDRVETIVNWALDAELYVIINDHWDGGWYGMFGSHTPEIRESAFEMYEAMWKQIGNRFKNYNEYLIFEGANEELGAKLNETTSCWDSGALSVDQMYETTNMINQLFVNTIRSQGGNNKERYLLIPGFDTDVRKTVDDRWKLPEDSAEDKLLVSVHYYDPSPLCIGKGDEWGSKGDIADMAATLKLLTKFTDEGTGVVIGEYGVLPNPDYKSATYLYHSLFLDCCDELGICPVLWDTGNACFYNKSKAEIRFDDLANLYKAHCLEIENSVSQDVVKAAAQQRFAKAYRDAPVSLSGSSLEGRKDIAIAYLMFADQNWGVNYSVGDEYKPSSKSKGITAVDKGIEKAGEYSVKIDFTTMKADGSGKASGMGFSALGIANGETLHPDWIIEIKSIKVNDKEIPLTKKNYTSTDGNNTTRANIMNDWVTAVPKDARTADGNLSGCGATIVSKNSFIGVKTYEVIFYYGPAN